jgi:hypothetical protein
MHQPKIARSSRHLAVVAVVVGLIAASCSDTESVTDTANSDQPDAETSETDETDATESATTSESANSSDSTGGDSSDVSTSVPDAVTEEDLARFIAATEAALVGTSAEGLILEAPEIYIAIAQASCARFTQGDSLQQIVNDHLDDNDTTPVADDEQLIGALLGAAVETICPEHAAKV